MTTAAEERNGTSDVTRARENPPSRKPAEHYWVHRVNGSAFLQEVENLISAFVRERDGTHLDTDGLAPGRGFCGLELRKPAWRAGCGQRGGPCACGSPTGGPAAARAAAPAQFWRNSRLFMEIAGLGGVRGRGQPQAAESCLGDAAYEQRSTALPPPVAPYQEMGRVESRRHSMRWPACFKCFPPTSSAFGRTVPRDTRDRTPSLP